MDEKTTEPLESDDLKPDAPEGLHPNNLQQQTPLFISNFISSSLSFIATNGWYILTLFLLCFLLWNQFKDRIYAWLRHREEMKESAEMHKNPDKYLEREKAREEAVKRMQERYSTDATKHAELMAEKEEEKRQQKIQEWENHEQGKGYYSKSRSTNTGENSTSAAMSKPSGKPRLRPEYNPLMGGGASSGWRPTRQSGSGGG